MYGIGQYSNKIGWIQERIATLAIVFFGKNEVFLILSDNFCWAKDKKNAATDLL